MQQVLTEELDRLRDDVIAYRLSLFTPLVNGMWSINRIWDAVRRLEQIKRVGEDDRPTR